MPDLFGIRLASLPLNLSRQLYIFQLQLDRVGAVPAIKFQNVGDIDISGASVQFPQEIAESKTDAILNPFAAAFMPACIVAYYPGTLRTVARGEGGNKRAIIAQTINNPLANFMDSSPSLEALYTPKLIFSNCGDISGKENTH